MITTRQYFTNPTTGEGKDHTEQHEINAEILLRRVEQLVEHANTLQRFKRRNDADTGTEISGKVKGTGGGGFRGPDEEGAEFSNHKQARAVDVFDPGDQLDKWLDEYEDGEGGNTMLDQYGLYREHPDDTPGWCHLQTRAPGSGRRTFKP